MLSESFRSLLSRLRPVVGDIADAFWLGALLDPEREKDIHAAAQVLAAELLDESYRKTHVLLEPPPGRIAHGEYPLGTVVYAGRSTSTFCLREGDFPQHLLVIGRSGAGKTNVGCVLVWNLLRAGKPFVVLDWRRNYRGFLDRPEGKDALLFTLGEDESLSFNPLDPPSNLSPSQCEAYLRDLVSVVCTTYLPGHHLLSTRGVEYLLLKALDALTSGNGKPPTFNDVRHYIEAQKTTSREADWKASAANVLFRLTTGPVGRLVNGAGRFAVSDIMHKPVILELDRLGSESDRALFANTFLLWLYYHRLAEGKSPSFKHAIIVEEAHNVFVRRDTGYSIPDAMIRQMRDLGQSLVLLDQNPSLLSVPALGNTGTTVCLNLKHGDDVKAAGKALTLPPEEWQSIGRLPVGQAIVKVQDRWPTPFLVRIPRFDLPAAQKPCPGESSVLPGDSLQRTAEELRAALDEAIRALPTSDGKEGTEPGISPQERSLLFDVAEHPLSVVTERYQRLGWSAHTGTKVKRSLLEKGLAEEERIGVPEGTVTLMKLDEKGRDVLAEWGVDVKPLPKNASLEHEYHRELVARHFREKGYDVKQEVHVGEGRTVDLVAVKGDERIAIEIETGKSSATDNLYKCAAARFERMYIVATSDEALRTISETLPHPQPPGLVLTTTYGLTLSARTARRTGQF